MNVLEHYTLAHINHFLPEIDRRRRRLFKDSIIAARVAQADQKGYQSYMRQLAAAERAQQQQVAKSQGRRLPMTYEEQVKLASQKHLKFAELTPAEQAAMTAERESLWSQIPAHIQAKSRKLAGR